MNRVKIERHFIDQDKRKKFKFSEGFYLSEGMQVFNKYYDSYWLALEIRNRFINDILIHKTKEYCVRVGKIKDDYVGVQFVNQKGVVEKAFVYEDEAFPSEFKKFRLSKEHHEFYLSLFEE